MYNVCLCKGEIQHGFKNVASALEWASGRNGSYFAEIRREGVEAPDDSIRIQITHNDGEATFSYYCMGQWLPATINELARMI